jgi:uncharacterized protein with NAD-binding domain and iron-sulfur cluster
MAIEAIAHAGASLLHLAGPPAPATTTGGGIPHWLATHLPHPLSGAGDATLAATAQLARSMPRDPSAQSPVHQAGLLWLLEEAKDWLVGHLTREAATHPILRRSVIELDLGLTMVIGCLRDGVHRDGFGAIDAEDARAWFRRHGAAETSVESTPVRALYDLYFAYRDGDIAQPSFSAGVAINAVLRLALGYKGAVVNEMRAGMGEIVIAPIYEVLANRGVRFAFFHRVDRIEPSADRSRIDRIHLARQVDLADGTTTGYRPLVDAEGLPCWPAGPRLDQLKDGHAVDGVDLESRWSGWTDVGTTTLEAGTDFDVAVLGVSLAGIPDIAPDFRTDRRWADLFDQVGTIQTMSAELWLDASLDDLGWTLGPVPTDAAPEPLDVWADRSETLPLEAWPAPAPTTVQYLCGPMPGRAFERPPTDRAVPAEAAAEVETTVTRWLADGGIGIWPGLRAPDGTVDWTRFHDPSGATGEARLRAQYLRANIDPSERYVLSLPGTARYRLGADESGFDNLVLAGDWTRTDWNVGCIEAAVLSGIAAARVVSGPPVGARASAVSPGATARSSSPAAADPAPPPPPASSSGR